MSLRTELKNSAENPQNSNLHVHVHNGFISRIREKLLNGDASMSLSWGEIGDDKAL